MIAGKATATDCFFNGFSNSDRTGRFVKPDNFKPKTVAKPRKRRSAVSQPNHANRGPTYVFVRRGTVKETRDLYGGVVMADFDKAGNLLGVEIIR